MKRHSLTFLAMILLSHAALAANIGEPAPAFSGVDVISGKTISNATVKGKITVLEWNNFGCPFVHKFYDSGTMQKLQAAALKGGVVWISVNSSAQGKEGYLADAPEANAALTQHHSKASHYLLDAEGIIGHAFGAKVTPHMFVIAADGTLAYQGAIDSIPSPDRADIAKATNYVTQTIAALKSGTPIKTASTQAYGCFVKY